MEPSFAKEKLQQLVSRIERLEEDRVNVMEDIKEVYAEAKGHGFDTTILRKIIRIRKQDKAKREEEVMLLQLYEEALEM